MSEWLTTQKPDVVFWQGLHPDDVLDVEKALGMDAYVGGPRPLNRHDIAVLVPADGPVVVEEMPWHRDRPPGEQPAHLVARLRGPDGEPAPGMVNLVSVRACEWDCGIRRSQAGWLTTLAHPGQHTIVAGLFHDVPAGAAPDWSWTSDPALAVQRTHPVAGGRDRAPDDVPDRTLTSGGFVDAAVWCASGGVHGGEPLAPTSGYGPEEPGDWVWVRDVRAYVTHALAPAVTCVRVGAAPEVGRALGRVPAHLPLVVDLDRDVLHRAVSTTARPPAGSGPVRLVEDR